jgi:hypothetical protein
LLAAETTRFGREFVLGRLSAWRNWTTVRAADDSPKRLGDFNSLGLGGKMMTRELCESTADLWGRFRFSVVGSLLSSSPVRGELMQTLESLADKTWTHPVTGRDV